MKGIVLVALVALMGAIPADQQALYVGQKCVALRGVHALSDELTVDDIGLVLRCGSAEYIPQWRRIR